MLYVPRAISMSAGKLGVSWEQMPPAESATAIVIVELWTLSPYSEGAPNIL